MFLTHHNLQGSQTHSVESWKKSEFLTHHNLQGSQTYKTFVSGVLRFLTHHNLQGSQTIIVVLRTEKSFLPIIIYKVLKLCTHPPTYIYRFLPIIIYKVLKLHLVHT